MMKKYNKEKVLETFLENPEKGFSLREIERTINLGLPSIRRYVSELLTDGYIQKKEIGKIILYYADSENQVYKRKKIFHTIEKIFNSGAIDFINEQLSYPTIVLFGSCSKGEDTKESDIDLYIESPGKEISLRKYEKKVGKNIQITRYEKMSKIKNKHLANNIANGIVLSGFLEVIR